MKCDLCGGMHTTYEHIQKEKPSPQVAGLGAVVEFIQAKLAESEKALRCRKEADQTWRGGTDASWRAVGCRYTKVQRLKNADAEGRIAIRCQREVDLFKATLMLIQAPNNQALPQGGK